MSGGRKFDKKKYKDLRDFKTKEIKRSLTHRARLRKNYFKLLEKEQKDSKHPVNEEHQDHNKEDNNSNDHQEKHNEDNDSNEYLNPAQKSLTYAERSQLIKQRKEQKRREALKALQDKRSRIERTKIERERAKESLSKKTKYGQPLMGPRINNLLDKIRKDQQ